MVILYKQVYVLAYLIQCSLLICCIVLSHFNYGNAKNINSSIRDVKQVYPSRSVPYRGGLVVERVTASLSHAGCSLQNAGPNPYHRIYRPSRAVPRNTSLSNCLLQLLSLMFLTVLSLFHFLRFYQKEIN